jgi:hypothetical protein
VLPVGQDPDAVLEELNKFKQKYKLNSTDELWLVIDFDRWGDQKISRIARLCSQKGYYFAVSRPCFEFWLLLHVKSITDYQPRELIELEKNQKYPQAKSKRTRVDYELLQMLGKYNKSNIDIDAFLPYVKFAITQAQNLNSSSQDRWPQTLGSDVYRLAQSILKS